MKPGLCEEFETLTFLGGILNFCERHMFPISALDANLSSFRQLTFCY